MSVTRINRWIGETELKWLPELQAQCTSIFENTFLPSHDQDHHRRVWENGRLLLVETSGFNPFIDRDLVEALMVAAWFHDTGMVRDAGPSHGQIGREFFEIYLKRQHPLRPALLDETLDAIEFHDSKEKMVYRPLDREKRPGIMELLSVSDDMDAFGTIGIYRYAEIYLHRGISLPELGIRILKNAGYRHFNAIRCCENCPAVRERVSQGFSALRRFYDLYNQQLAVCDHPSHCTEGHLGIVNHIRKHCMEEKIPPSRLAELIPAGRSGLLSQYFLDLKNELYK